MSSRDDRKQKNLSISDYVLTFETGPEIGLVDVDSRKMLQWSGSFADNLPLQTNLAFNSIPYQFGFSFPFNGRKYDKFVIGETGFCVLIDNPNSGSFDARDVFDFSGFPLDTFANDHVLINAWTSYRHAPKFITEVENNTTDQIQLLNIGQYDPTIPLASQQYWSERAGGIRYIPDTHLPDGSKVAIVRWNTLTAFSKLATFELVFYENGKIELRFQSSEDIRVPPNSAEVAFAAELGISEASSCVIYCKSASVDFRDFSTELENNFRLSYKYGGYNSSSLNIDMALVAAENWPGGLIGGGLFTFQALPNKRKILPKALIHGTTPRVNSNSIDDRKILFFNSGTRNIRSYPTQLTRFYQTNAPGVADLQDLYTNDIEVTGSATQSIFSGFPLFRFRDYRKPFSDENDEIVLNDSFFSSGSIDGFQTTARSQTKINISLPVDRKTQLLPTSSTAHYYNTKTQSWVFPQNSLIVGANVTAPDLITSLSSTIAHDIIPEDARGFTALGVLNSSGSSPIGVHSPSSALRGASISLRSDAITTKFEKSILNNPDYFPRNDEVFSLPIEAPFVMEKAIIEIPFTFGDQWFKDITSLMVPFDSTGSFTFNSLTSSLFDIGGPALTVALLNKIGNSKNSPQIDLVLSSTITHQFDDTAQVQIFKNSLSAGGVLRHIGFRSFQATPGSVVSHNMSSSAKGYSFTGSVKIQAEASVSNGTILGLHGDALTHANLSSSAPYQAIYDFITTRKLALQNGSYLFPFNQKMIVDTHINQIKPYGRAMTGFLPSGRSIFGKEHKAISGIDNNNIVDNPLFVDDESNIVDNSIYSYIINMVGHNYVANQTISMVFAAIPLISSTPSPYLFLPGDELTLSISKTRPTIHQKSGSIAVFSGTTGHDVYLNTGSINITLYGSYIKDGKAFNTQINSRNKLNQTAVYDTIIGDDPIFDQFEPSYNSQYLDTFSDAVVTGALYRKVSKTQLTESQRGKVFSSVLADRSYVASSSGFISNLASGSIVPATASLANSLSDYVVYQYEKFAKIQITQQLNSTETFYDSYPPDVTACWRADGVKIAKISYLSGSSSALFLNVLNLTSSFVGTKIQALNNSNFARSFPFEPRYHSATRRLDPQQVFTANYDYDASADLANPEQLRSTIISFGAGNEEAGIPVFDDIRFFNKPVADNDAADSFNAQNNLKILFGFGDLNTMVTSSISSSYYNGSNNLVEPRIMFQTDPTSGFSSTSYAVGPVPRGWKRGLISGYAMSSKTYFRRGKYGQFRDMLEQRLDSKYYQPNILNSILNQSLLSLGAGVLVSRFVDSNGLAVDPLTTQLSNLSTELTSSVPYFDGEAKNR